MSRVAFVQGASWGTVDTELSRPFSKRGLDVFEPDRAARQLLAITDGATAADSGSFFAWDGSPIPW